MNYVPSVSPILTSVFAALCLFSEAAQAVDQRALTQQVQVNGTTTNGNFFSLVPTHIVQRTDGVVTADVRTVFFVVNNQGFLADDVGENAFSFDIEKGIATINTPVPGCPGGAVVNISATSDTIETKTKTTVKGLPGGKQKFNTETKTRDATNVTGTLCGTAIDTVFFGLLFESSTRTVFP